MAEPASATQDHREPPLVVDLDGTLLRSDMLYESFFAALGRDWLSPVRAGKVLLEGGRFLSGTLYLKSGIKKSDDAAALKKTVETLRAYMKHLPL